LAHEAATPYLRLPQRPTDHEVEALIQSNLDSLDIGPDFGLKLQSVTRENLFAKAVGSGQTIVRVQLTQGRGDGAAPLENHGILVFRRDGALADYHSPMPPAEPESSRPCRQTSVFPSRTTSFTSLTSDPGCAGWCWALSLSDAPILKKQTLG
jgi:hypothetical protein